MPDVGVSLARPEALWLLAVLPVFWLAWVARGRRNGLPKAALPLRLGVVALMTLTLAEPLLTRGGGAISTVFVVDRSRSLTEGTGQAVNDWIADALNAAGASDRASVIEFGASPLVAEPPGRATGLGRGWQETSLDDRAQEYTDVESALALARALPMGGSRRVVLLSDGAENVGAAINQAGEAAADGTPIDVVPLAGVGGNDLRVEGATAPTSTWQGEPFTVLASVASGLPGDGTVELWVDGVLKHAIDASFPAGLSSYPFLISDLDQGFHTLDVRVTGTTATDQYPDNNALPLAMVVRGQPRLLLVAPLDSDATRLQRALETGGGEVTLTDPANVPFRLSELGVYDAVILDNVPADALTFEQLAALQTVARKLGRGLVVIGGTAAYGPGGYAGTLLEEALPVTVKVTDGRERQRVAVLLIMDKSGSMTYDPGSGAIKIDMAKEAVRVAARSLADGDQVGILVFNDKQHWIINMMTIEGDATREEIDAAVEAIAADGGTEIYPALSVGFDAIREVDADVRHVVLLSDGKSRTGTRESYQKLIDDVISDRTTLSTIAIGDDADTDLLQFLAEAGNGRYHFTNAPEDIPKLTLEEAQSAGNQSVIRGDFIPIQTQPSPILLGFDPAELPALDGYDFAEAKPETQVVLTSSRDDPVLTKWQYGLGRVVAWTADDGADFALSWASWSRYDEFWNNVVRWSLPDPENRPIQVGVTRDGAEAIITIDAVGEDGDFIDLADVQAAITTPSGVVVDGLSPRQTGPGHYELRVAAPEPGAYQVDLSQTVNGTAITELAGFAVPPSPELQPSTGGGALLRALAARTGGRVLSLDNPANAFQDNGLRGTALRDYRAVWYVPLLLALVVLLGEIAMRLGFTWKRLP